MKIIFGILFLSMNVFASESHVKPLPIVKKKPAGMVYVHECQPAPPVNGRPALFCKPVKENKK